MSASPSLRAIPAPLVYNVATEEEMLLRPTTGDEKSTWLFYTDLYGEPLAGEIGSSGRPRDVDTTRLQPLFTSSGDYEVRRYFEGCPEVTTSFLFFPLTVEVRRDFVAGAIYFEDSVVDSGGSLNLLEFSDGAGCVGADEANVQDTTRYVCAPEDAPTLLPFEPWSLGECGVERMCWQYNNGSIRGWDDFGLIVGSEETGSSLSSEAIESKLVEGGSVSFRRQDINTTTGNSGYTNELTIVWVSELEPSVTPEVQDVCATGTFEELSVSFGGSSQGELRYQWQGRDAGVGPYSDIADATGSTFTPQPRLQSAEYRVKVWQSFELDECGPYVSEAVEAIVSPGAVPYYPDGDGDGYPNKDGELRLLCEAEEGWVSARRAEDCADGNPFLHPGQRWYFDEDGDGLIARGTEVVVQCLRPSPPQNWRLFDPENPLDCDDTDPDQGQGAQWAEDRDGDGFGSGASVWDCLPPPGYRAVDEIVGPDCNDEDAHEFPGQSWYRDDDGDGHGSGPIGQSCVRPGPEFFAADELFSLSDCDDMSSVYSAIRRWYRDEDGDGYPAEGADGGPDFVESCRPTELHNVPEEDLLSEDVDCDDTDPERFPGQRWYPDRDGDGFGNALLPAVVSCAPPDEDHVSNHRDCDDGDPDPALCMAGPDAGQALSFATSDAEGLGVSALDPNLGNFDLSDFVVGAWISTFAEDEQTIISKGSLCQSGGAWWIGISSSGNLAAVLTRGRQTVELEGTTAIADGECHHVALRRRGDEFSIWVDAEKEDQESSGNLSLRAVSPLYIGSDVALEGEECRGPYVGLIDDVRIWTGENLSSAFVDYHRVVEGDAPGLVAHWSFDPTSTELPNATVMADSAQGFPLLNRLEFRGIVESTAPIGEGVAAVTAFLGETDPDPDVDTSAAGLTIAGATIDAPFSVVLTTRLTVPPVGSPVPEGVPLGNDGEEYWCLDLLGPTSEIGGDVTFLFDEDAIPAELESRPGDISLYQRPANSLDDWTEIATATTADAALGEIRFDGLALSRSQLALAYASDFPELLLITDETLDVGSVRVGLSSTTIVSITNIGGANADASLLVSGSGTAFTSDFAGFERSARRCAARSCSRTVAMRTSRYRALP